MLAVVQKNLYGVYISILKIPVECTLWFSFYRWKLAHSSTLAWKIPWMAEPGRLQSMGSLRVRHDWATSLSLFTFTHWRRKWQPTPVFLPGESQGRGFQTRLKRLSSSSSRAKFRGLGWETTMEPNSHQSVWLKFGLLTTVFHCALKEDLFQEASPRWVRQCPLSTHSSGPPSQH